MTQTATTPRPPAGSPADRPAEHGPSLAQRALRALLTERIVLLAVLIVVVVVWMTALDAGGYLTGAYDPDYLAGSLVDAVPLAMLALAELLVIVSGRGGIDLSIGAVVSLTGMVFGIAYGQWHWALLPSVLLCVATGAVLGAVNGVMVAYLRFPALIATLASYYAWKSIALVVTNASPVSDPKLAELYSITRSVSLPVIGGVIPDFPLGLFTFLVPTVVVVWLLIARTTYGRRLFAIGTNDVAGEWSGLDVRRTRFLAYVLAGVVAGLVAVYISGEFASARPDAGTSGNGLALPAITVAVLGGVAISGGIGRVAGVVLATLLITWLNAGILLAFEGNDGTQFQLLALGAVLVFSALLNGLTTRRFTGSR
ncbi:ABC transporter permease [Lapillicoccus jejuensis]|uniref:Autoinducer 2 import system permease protein LsrD n=1 Tax=Lapillicoccus jejuensis TaxID=402171 RepID=A0A542DVF9_9MICO|nr:ABC transporter permease [Lapillicoccus jejuensis]TQJ07036.1 monosaccharide ABC transporter membrane protein (CUT2 family) [Lapillicoccus jejuensis]